MKKMTAFLSMACATLFIFTLFAASAVAQSTDPDNPTVVTQSVVQGKNSSGETVVYYYTFTAGPGVLKVTTDQKSGGITANYNLSWELTDANFKKLASEDFYGVTTSERKVTEIKLAKKQKVILKAEVTEDVENFKFQFAGAVNFTGSGTGTGIGTGSGMGNGDGTITDLTGDSSGSQQICMPRNGVLILTMQDGKKARVDLSKVQKIEIQ